LLLLKRTEDLLLVMAREEARLGDAHEGERDAVKHLQHACSDHQ
jgi:hypothetical protein